MMTRTPPNRRGITFEIGAPLEARDSLKNWYAASIEKIDFDEERVLIHYRQWSHRYDEWFDWGSPYLRPVERIQLRKEGLRERNVGRGFHVNDKVLASWSDCRFYPARVLSVNKDASYTIKFFDGVIQTVKEIHVKPFHKDTKGGKSKREEKNKDRVESKQEKNRRLPERACVSTENGNIKSKRSARRSTADRSGENGNEEQPTPPVGKAKKDELEVESGKKGCRTVSGVEQGGEKPGAGVGGHGGPAGPQPDRQPADAGKLPELMEVKAEVEISEPSEHLSAGPEPLSREASHQNQGRQTRLAEGGTEPEHDILELRKRKICLGQTAPVKRSRLDSSSDKAVPVESKLAKSDAATTKRETPDVEDQTETARPPVEQEAAPVVRRAQQPNPNKYSREPLYRVVKNQPPPVLSINLDHNPFKCKAPGCLKSFRKAKLLHYHVKYYHDGDQSAMAGLGSPRSVQTRASERQDVPPESPRTRRTPSTPLSSSTHSVHRATHPSRTGKPNERKRVLTPPSGSTGNHSQVSLHENSRENLEKMRFRAFQREQNATDAVTKERVNEARLKDFLRIRLKKRRRMRKKKKPKSDEDSCSDWSTDSMMWSTEELEEELGVELDTAQGGTTVAQGSDIVRCICKVQEEDDFMIQCEECLSWQHGACMGLMEDNVPERYACYICRYLPGQRRSLHYRHDSDWLSRGHMYGLSFLEENYSDRNAAKITAAHQLLGDVHHVIEVLSGLQLKINILQSQSHPDLKLWCQPWKRVEKPRKRAVPPSVVTNDGLDRGGAEEASRTSARDSYISSEHCYQKPHAYYPATEQRLVVETRDSELEDSLRSTEDLLTLEHRYGVPPELDGGKVDRPARAKKADGCGKQSAERGSEVKSEAMPPGEMEWQWQVNLLDHIEAVQEEVTSRMDFIEKELDVLESWLDHTGELEPPEPLARLPQLKLRIKQLLADLGKVQQIALCCST